MSVTVAGAEVSAAVAGWVWPFLRTAAVLTAAPVVGAAYVPARVRLALALALSFVLVPLVTLPPIEPLSLPGGLVAAEQVLVGLMLGFAVRLVVAVFDLAGQVLGQTMGLGLAAMVDPATGTQVPALSQLYLVLASLVFVTIDGHLLLVQALAESFRVFPVAGSGLEADPLWLLASKASWVFGSAVLMALPGVTAMLVVNLAMAVMTRAAPQLNVFAVGFPVTLIVGLAVILLTLPAALLDAGRLVTEAVGFAGGLLAGGAGG